MLTDSALTRAAASPSLTLVCLCNHDQNLHSTTGHCRVPGCPCEDYQPMPEIGSERTRGA